MNLLYWPINDLTWNQVLSEGAFGPYGRGPEHLGAPNWFGFNTRYSGISAMPIIRQQEKILKSLVEVAENLNLKPEEGVELSILHQKTSLKLSL